MKYLIFLIFLNNCFSQSVNNHKVAGEIYYSKNSSNKTFMCYNFFDFTKDSLYLFNSSTSKISKFELELNEVELIIANKENTTHKIKYLNNDKYLLLLDYNHIFSNMDTLRLNKIKTGYIDKKYLNNLSNSNKFWISNNNKNNLHQTLWFKFNKDGYLNYYTKQFSNSELTLTRNRFELINISNKLNLIRIHGDFTYYLISNLSKTRFTLFMYRCNEDELYLNFKINDSFDKINLNGYWNKISSFEEFELPKNLFFDENNVHFNSKKFNFFMGIDNKFIHLNNGMDFEIVKFKNDTLKLEIKNSAHIKEKATYIIEK